jgi:hypothetical protein
MTQVLIENYSLICSFDKIKSISASRFLSTTQLVVFPLNVNMNRVKERALSAMAGKEEELIVQCVWSETDG